MKNILFISAAIGYLGGMACAYYVVRKLLAGMASAENRKLVTRIGGAVGAAGVLPASILAAVLGGNLGGGIGAGAVAPVAGVFAGIFLIMFAGIVLPAVVAGYLVRIFTRDQ